MSANAKRTPWEAKDRLQRYWRAYLGRLDEMVEALEKNDDGSDPELTEWWWECFRDHLESVSGYVAYYMEPVERFEKDKRLRDKITQLREGTSGRTEAEIETGRRLADRLEAKAGER
jgi:hypothetical protein